MKYLPKYPKQSSGEMHRWANPEDTFRLSFVKVNFDYEADPYPGVLILTDTGCRNAKAIAVEDLRRELAGILAPLGDDTIAYWCLIADETARDQWLAHLTSTPVFADRQ